MKFDNRPPRKSRRSRWLVVGCVLLLVSLALPAAARPGLSELIDALELSGYPPDWRPPHFQTRTPEGVPVSLADFRGRVVLVNFWASWCVPCLEEMPAFEQLHRDFAPEGLTVLGINLKEEEQIIRDFGRLLGLTFALVLDPKGEISSAYGVVALPVTFLLGRDGRPVALAVGKREWAGEEARALIRLLLAEPIPAKHTQ